MSYSGTTQGTESGMGIKLFLAWAFVGVPLLWGVYLTCLNAVKLFQ